MSDAQLVWNDYGADIQVQNGDIVPDDGLASAVLISLFTDARSPDAALLPPGELSLRGWWGDLSDRTTGSLLWLINREKVTNEVAARAREYALSALQWLKDEGIAEKVEVVSTLVRPFSLQLKITITRGAAKRYSYLWDAVDLYRGATVQNTSIQLQFIE